MIDVPGPEPKSDEDWQARIFDALELFSPGAPIDESSLLAGRSKQIDRMSETVLQRGQHAILYGERGVGKSSLANTFSTKLLGGARSLTSIPINCHPSDDFSRVWRNVFRRMRDDVGQVSDRYPNQIYPDDVVIELDRFSLNTISIIILDEFDKLPDQETRNLIANTIKDLSDKSVRTTVILVGVADSVDKLIEEHHSISRCLRQIPMQRMFPSELMEIIRPRLAKLGMTIEPGALTHMIALSRGLPHYAHLYGQQSAKSALQRRQTEINMGHFESAMTDCIEQTDQTLRTKYHKATMSPRKENIYMEVLLACALSQVDDLGYFAPSDIKRPLSELIGREAPISLFGQHLKKLCEAERGQALEVTGTERKYRYRFVEPMMQPFVLLNGRKNKLITREQVDALAATISEPRLSDDF